MNTNSIRRLSRSRRLGPGFFFICAICVICGSVFAQDGPKKHVLVFGMSKGYHHDSISPAMATVWKLGKESGVWDTVISTDPDLIRKPPEGKPGGGFVQLNLYNFDAVVFANTTGETPFDDQQKKD